MDAKMMFLDFILRNNIHTQINELLSIYPNYFLEDLIINNELITKGTSLYIMNYLITIERICSADSNFALEYSNNIIGFFKDIPEMTDILKYYLPHQHARSNLIDLDVVSYDKVSERLSDIIEIKKKIYLIR
jgi:hypothetical protein